MNRILASLFLLACMLPFPTNGDAAQTLLTEDTPSLDRTRPNDAVASRSRVMPQSGKFLDDFKQPADVDDTASMLRAVVACVPVRLGSRTYIINNFSYYGNCNNFVLSGLPGISVIQRTSASGNVFFDVWSPNVFIDGVIFDMNSSNVKADQWGPRFARGGQKIIFTHNVVKNNSGSVGECVSIFGEGPMSGGSFDISESEFTNCGSNAIMLGSVSHGVVSHNYIHDIGNNGVWVSAYNGPASDDNYATDIKIEHNQIERMTNGIALGGWGSPVVFLNPPVTDIKVAYNQFVDVHLYSVVAGGENIVINENDVRQSSPSVKVFGGIDMLARHSIIMNNHITLNGSPWCIDIGGSIGMTLTGNIVSMSSGIAINVGGNQDALVSKNQVTLSGNAIGVYVAAVEASSMRVVFPTLSSSTSIVDNQIDGGGNSSTKGIYILDNAGGFAGLPGNTVRNNRFVKFNRHQQAITWIGSASSLAIDGNEFDGTKHRSLNTLSNGDLIFDAVDFGGTIISESSSLAIQSIMPRLFASYGAGDSILYVTPLSHGSGYSFETTLKASDSGGGSGWTGTPMIYKGEIIGVHTKSYGAGYSGNVEITAIDPGGGSGAVLAASTYPHLPEGGTINVSTEQTQILRVSGGFVPVSARNPLYLSSSSKLTLQTAKESNGRSWSIANYDVPLFASNALPLCDINSLGSMIHVSNTDSSESNMACNGIGWIYTGVPAFP